MVALAALAAITSASAQNYPSRAIRVISSESGSASDFTARLITPGVSSSMGQPVVVDNRPGVIAVDTVLKAPPDGYTVLVYGATLWLAPLMQKTAYDPVKDFSPVTLATAVPLVLVVHPSVPASSIRELIELAKAKPGVLNYGSAAVGGPSHLAPELFKHMGGALDIVRVNYKGTGPAINALIGGEVQLMITPASPVMSFARAGKLKIIAVTSPEASALLPGYPPVAAALPGYDFQAVIGVSVPAATPDAIVKRLNQEFVRALTQPEIKQKFFNDGSEVVAGSPAQFAAEIKAEMTRLGEVVKSAGIHVE
jgi:tripartite-type tricarboxylate transporter receptor subunit TctC